MTSPSSQKVINEEFVNLIKDDLIEFYQLPNNLQIKLQSLFSNLDRTGFANLVKDDLIEFYQLPSNLHLSLQRLFSNLDTLEKNHFGPEY